MATRRTVLRLLAVAPLLLLAIPAAEAGEARASKTLKAKKATHSAMALAPDGKTIATSTGGAIDLWNLESEKVTRTLDALGYGANTLAFSTDSATLFVGDARGRVRRFDVASGVEGAALLSHQANSSLRSFPIAVSPDGKTLAAGDGNLKADPQVEAAVNIYSLVDGMIVRTLAVGGPSVQSIAYSRDGKLLAAEQFAGNTLLWDAATGDKKGEFSFGGGMVFCPDGSSAVGSVGATKAIGIWEVSSANERGSDPIREIKGHVNSVDCIAVSPDGNLIASGCRNYTGPKDLGIRIWDFKTGKRLRLFNADPTGVFALLFTSDGKTLITGGETAVKLWNLEKLLGDK